MTDTLNAYARTHAFKTTPRLVHPWQHVPMNPLQEAACRAHGVTLVRHLTPGGQKEVHLVRDAEGKDLVLKTVDFAGNSDAAALERARREVALLQSVDHPNIVKVKSDLVALGEPPNAVCWLEEYLDGNDLRQNKGPWSELVLIRFGQEVGSGLGTLHSMKVVHRDLSPGNVQMLASGRFVIMDPGFAKHAARTGLTVGGQPGTPGFMTPEHLHSYSGSPTPSSDVFACAALIYYLATGTPPVPYKGDDAEYVRRLRSAEHTPLRELRPDLDESLCAIVERALHAQPARRFRNGAALSQAFMEIS